MFFTIGVMKPSHEDEAYGLVVPALCNEEFGCFSAADEQKEIPVMAREAILLILEEMILSGKGIDSVQDAGVIAYQDQQDYIDYHFWVAVDVDISGLEGKQQRINIVLPDVLINRIDTRVKGSSGYYRDRSHFLSEAARHELASV